MFKILLLFILLSVLSATAQNSESESAEITPKDEIEGQLGNECFNVNEYDRFQRLNIYPFNKANTIQLISFKEGDFIPVKKRIVDYTKVIESCMLNAGQKDELTNILYNISYNPAIKPKYRLSGEYTCYEPRNGILFLNKEGKAFECIEICFDCQGTRASSKKVNQGTFCQQKFSLLQKFFLNTGIKYGATSRKEILNYSEILQLDTVDLLQAIRDKLNDKLTEDYEITRLSDIEQKILFLLNAYSSYDNNFYINNNFAEFYYGHSGAFYQETIAALDEAGATLNLAAFKSSLLQWPENIIPKNIQARREKLLEIANVAIPVWKTIESGLENLKIIDNTGYITSKEDLQPLIVKYIQIHKSMLID